MWRFTSFGVSLGNCRGPFMYPLTTAFRKVVGGGLPSAACTNWMCSASGSDWWCNSRTCLLLSYPGVTAVAVLGGRSGMAMRHRFWACLVPLKMGMRSRW